MGQKKKPLRFVKNVGLGFKTPREVCLFVGLVIYLQAGEGGGVLCLVTDRTIYELLLDQWRWYRVPVLVRAFLRLVVVKIVSWNEPRLVSVVCCHLCG